MYAPVEMIPVSHAGSIEYPAAVYACFDYFATGEGRTIGLLVMTATSEQDLLFALRQDFGEYYSIGVKVGIWTGALPQGFESVDPRPALEALDELFVERPRHRYVAKFHYNAG